MSDDPRNTQFAGFANLLYEELDKRDYLWIADGDEQSVKTPLSQRAYDLVQHALHSFELAELECCESRDELLPGIPDMTEFPKEPQ